MQTFEVIVHNEQVREKVRAGLHHRTYNDDWGDSHFVEIKAFNEGDALDRARDKYPKEDGFVIEGVSPLFL